MEGSGEKFASLFDKSSKIIEEKEKQTSIWDVVGNTFGRKPSKSQQEKQ